MRCISFCPTGAIYLPRKEYDISCCGGGGVVEMKGLEEKLNRAKLKVGKHLAIYGVKLPSVRIVLDSELEEGILATHRYPNIVVVMGNSVPKSVIAHELVHIAQRTLESFRGFKLLYHDVD